MTGWAVRYRQPGSGRRPCLVWLHGLAAVLADWYRPAGV